MNPEAPPRYPPCVTRLVLLFDSLPPSQLGCYGSDCRTPTIDSLAAEGLVFDCCYRDGDRARSLVVESEHVEIVRLDGVPAVGDTGFLTVLPQLPAKPLAELESLATASLGESAAAGDRPDERSPHVAGARFREIAANDRGAAETLLDFELLCCEQHIAAADALVAEIVGALSDTTGGEDLTVILTASRGWAPTLLDDPLLDTPRHVPAIVAGGAVRPQRDATLCTPETVITATWSGAAHELRYVAADGASLRTADALYAQRSDGEGGTIESLFVKPADRFDRDDCSRAEPSLVGQLADRLKSIGTA